MYTHLACPNSGFVFGADLMRRITTNYFISEEFHSLSCLAYGSVSEV
jgi:hypothetical protein